MKLKKAVKTKVKSNDRLKEALKWCKVHKVARSKEVIGLLTAIVKELRGIK